MNGAAQLTASNWLKAHEGLRLKPYRDSVGKLTIGYGRNLDDVGITQAEAEGLLQNDIAVAADTVAQLVPGFTALSVARQAVLVDMVFNLGYVGFAGFQKMRTALAAHDYTAASREMLSSNWASQVGARATFLARKMVEGV